MLHILLTHARLAPNIRHVPPAIHPQHSAQVVQPIFTRIARAGSHPGFEQLPHADQALIQFFALVQRNTPPSDDFSLFLLKFIRLFLPRLRSTLECDIVKIAGFARNFKFLKGYVFAGNYFHDINKTLPVALTVWEFAPSTDAHPLDLHFEFVDKNGKNSNVLFKKMPLLKDGWRYRDGNKYVKHKVDGAIGVPRCERFWTPRIKVLCTDIKEGSGAELSPDNLRSNQVLAPSIPSELIYAIWSVAVGKHAFGTSLSTSLHPIYFEQAYVHLPDLTRRETIEILAYSALHVLIKNYAENQIGFFGTNKVFRFGNERITNGVEYLFDLCKDNYVYDGYTIQEVFEQIKESKVDVTKCRRGMKEEVSKRLNKIGYWDYVPIP